MGGCVIFVLVTFSLGSATLVTVSAPHASAPHASATVGAAGVVLLVEEDRVGLSSLPLKFPLPPEEDVPLPLPLPPFCPLPEVEVLVFGVTSCILI